MVQALVELDEKTNRVLNIVKAKHGLKDKAQAIKFVVEEYSFYDNEPDLKPEFISLMEKIKRQESIKVDDFARRYGTSKTTT